MKTLKIFLSGLLAIMSLSEIVSAQDTTKKTTIISVDTTIIKNDSSRNITPPAPVQAPQPTVAPESPRTENMEEHPQVGFHFALRYLQGFSSISSSAYGSNSLKISGTTGYGYGGALSYYFNNYVDLQLEVLYSQLGQKYSDPQNKSREVKLSYINVPLLLGFNTDYGKRVNLNVTGGPQVGILTGSSIDGQSGGGEGSFNAILSAKAMDLGVAYGGGLDFGLGEKRHTHLNLGYRGVRGVLDIDNSNGSASKANNQYYILQKSKTNTNSFYVGLMFKL